MLDSSVDDKLQDRSALGTDSASIASQCRIWLNECTSGDPKHPKCTHLGKPSVQRSARGGCPPFIPTRLLDVGCDSTDDIRVIDTAKQGVDGPYLTLSHKWGNIETKHRFQLTKETKKDRYKGFDLDSIPEEGKTFREAIVLARELEIRYLWIDTLCIIQGDDDEWLREGAKMEQVYTNSICNLAAVDSEDISCGLFGGQRDPAQLPPDIVEHRGSNYTLIRPDFWKHQVLDRPLYSRGWVFQGKYIRFNAACTATNTKQERMLAPRILHFTSEQVFWQCPSFVACESSPGGLPYDIDSMEAKLELKWSRALHRESGLSSLSQADMNNTWRNMVFSYTSCNLTKSKDKLHALSGVAMCMGKAFKSKYLAGLWDAVHPEDRPLLDFPNQLGWFVKDGKGPDGSRSRRYEEYRAPTWSWASLNGAVILEPRIIQPNKLYEAEIAHAYVNLQDDTIPAGPVRRESTCLKVSGKLLRKVTFERQGSGWSLWKDEGGKAYVDDHRDVGLVDEDSKMFETLSADVLLLLCYASGVPDVHENERLSHSGHGLLVKKTGDRTAEYVRLGVFKFEDWSRSAWKMFEERAEHVGIVLV